MPPRRAVNGRRDSVASADGPVQGRWRRRSWQLGAGDVLLGAGDVLQERGIPCRAGVPFQGEEALPRSLPLLVIAALPQRWRTPAGRLGTRRPSLHDHSRPKAVGPSGGQLCVGRRGINGSAAQEEGRLAPSLRGVHPPTRIHFSARVDLPASLRESTSPRGPQLPTADLLERRIPDGAVAAVTREVGTTAFVGFAWPI
jgi:hypothetical protein